MVGVARGHQRADTLKPYSQKTSQFNHTRTTALFNSRKLSHARGATQDGRVMVERSDRMWSTGEGNGNPLRCSCLENPRDRGAWWAAVSGVTHSRTRLKRLSSSSRTIGCQAPLSMEFSSKRRLPCPPPGDLPDPGIEPVSLTSPVLAGRLLTVWAKRGAPAVDYGTLFPLSLDEPQDSSQQSTWVSHY